MTSHAFHNGGSAILPAYSREFLLSLRNADSPAPNLNFDLDSFTERTTFKKKKRGSRGGIRNRLRKRGCRLPLPVITLANVRSLQNKLDELSVLTKQDCDYRRSSLLCFTETWLTDDMNVNLDGFTTIRFDRDATKTQKRVGGGLCMMVNNKWANNFTIRESVSCKHYEILTVSFRPFYLPREFGQITVILVYVPGPNFDLAADRIAESYNKALNRSPDQPVLLAGDFNRCDVTKLLPTLHQYVSGPTRLDKTLDMCFGNIPDAYISRIRPPLGRSDHNVIHLLPRYRQKLKSEPPQTQQIKLWTKDSIETLRNCFETTDWDVFFDSCESDQDELSDTITSYVLWCERVVPTKEVRIYPNNKPWLSKELKHFLNEKKLAFIQGDMQKVREMEKDFRRQKKIAKAEYKDKVEVRFKGGNAREAWKGLNTMMGREQQKQLFTCQDPHAFVNELNTFYARFDVKDFSQDCDDLCQSLIPSSVNISEENVVKIFSHINPRKAPGPDGLRGKVLRVCSLQLGQVFARLFQMLLDSHFVPRVWRTSNIVPIPKKTNATLMKDFRPVALTPVLCKCMERIVSYQLTSSVFNQLDPLQFAYRANRGVEDATLTLFHTILKHLDTAGNYVRVLFMDFSSAFNTVQPHLLIQRLINLQVNNSIILWIRSFVNNRPQRVVVQKSLFKTVDALSDKNLLSMLGDIIVSDELVLNTGVPQGCVLSPLLFSIYTNEIMCNSFPLMLVKYADDMALAAQLRHEESLAEYFAYVSTLVTWFDSSYLELNVQKTKELCITGPRSKPPPVVQPLMIKEQEVEIVSSFKYLGTVVDQNFSFNENVDLMYKKAQQRLYLLRKLRSFNVSTDILQTVYRSLVESVITFNIISWFGNLSVRDKARLTKVVNQASKIVGCKQKPLSELYSQGLRRKGFQIVNDASHPLNCNFEFLPSRRRLKVPLARKNIFKKSFVPSAIQLLNSELAV